MPFFEPLPASIWWMIGYWFDGVSSDNLPKENKRMCRPVFLLCSSLAAIQLGTHFSIFDFAQVPLLAEYPQKPKP